MEQVKAMQQAMQNPETQKQMAQMQSYLQNQKLQERMKVRVWGGVLDAIPR